MNENIDIDTTFVPDDSASHSWAERDSELVVFSFRRAETPPARP